MPFVTALEFLTIVRLRAPAAADPHSFPRAVAYFPLVGILLGLILVALDLLLQLFLSRGVVDALLVVALAALTGLLHLDGLMDTCDGLLSANSPERRLEIMRDSRVGGFGVAGAVAVLLLKYAAIGTLAGQARLVGLLLAPLLARWAMVYAMVAFPYGRAEGLGSLFKPAAGRRALVLATASALLLGLVVAGAKGAVLLPIAWLGTWLLAKFTLGRIPGLTGDVYGAVNEVSETLTLILVPVVLAR